ncbi:MAG: hypothetical protein IH948_04180, partial [Bacteroidetes bacterium]|nr:hypothetical protein [Bacteroidota bacterium]
MHRFKSYLWLVILITLVIESADLFAQPDLPNPPANLEFIPSGSLVIPMDTISQNLIPPFNLKAYGLINALVQNDIPVKWIIRSGKAKNGIDFTSNVERLYPSFLPAAPVDFISGAFVVEQQYVNAPFYSFGKTASQVISSFGNSVAVYQLRNNENLDVRYTLDQRIKIAVFNNGGNQLLHTKILDFASFPNYVEIDAGVFTGLLECYTFASEPHWKSTKLSDTSITQKVRDFVMEGGNFFGQCRGILTYEDYELFHSNFSINILNTNVANAYYNDDLAYMQFHGNVVANQGGSERNWILNGGAWLPGFYYAISSDVGKDTIVAAGAHLIGPNLPGGNVFYLGGHDYFAKGAGDWMDLEQINAARMYLNAALIPSGRPTQFQVEIVPDTTICLGESIDLGGSPTGPPTATYHWVPAISVDDSTNSNPV